MHKKGAASAMLAALFGASQGALFSGFLLSVNRRGFQGKRQRRGGWATPFPKQGVGQGPTKKAKLPSLQTSKLPLR